MTPEPCPYCGTRCHADWCDVGVPGALRQVGPFHCDACGASEIGANDKERQLSAKEQRTGWYGPGSEPANVIAGRIVSHQEMLSVYRAEFTGNPAYQVPGAVDEWWEQVRAEVDRRFWKAFKDLTGISGAARFVLDDNVDVLVSRVKAALPQLLGAIEHARPPYPICWLESHSIGPTGVRHQNGYLVEATGGGALNIRLASRVRPGAVMAGYTVPSDMEIIMANGVARISDTGLHYRRDPSPLPPGVIDIDASATLAMAAGHTLVFFLLLNARNRVVQVTDGPDFTRLNRSRAKSGKAPLLSSKIIKLDLSRPIVQALRRGTSTNPRDLAAHVVRGHFKVRKSGVFWWSPFVRGGDKAKGDKPLPTYEVTASEA